MGTGVSFPGGKAWPRSVADQSPHLMPRSRMSRSYISSSDFNGGMPLCRRGQLTSTEAYLYAEEGSWLQRRHAFMQKRAGDFNGGMPLCRRGQMTSTEACLYAEEGRWLQRRHAFMQKRADDFNGGMPLCRRRQVTSTGACLYAEEGSWLQRRHAFMQKRAADLLRPQTSYILSLAYEALKFVRITGSEIETSLFHGSQLSGSFLPCTWRRKQPVSETLCSDKTKTMDSTRNDSNVYRDRPSPSETIKFNRIFCFSFY
jgi:hypothetical protein